MYPARDNRIAGRSLVPAVLISLAFPIAPAKAERMPEPLRFFEGRTELLSLVKVAMKKPYSSKTLGRGQILSDGSLSLVQQVNEQGKPTSHRRWLIRQVSPGRYTGTMSEALGPVLIQQIGGKFLFRFKVKGKLAVEQWITPLPGGKSARSKVTVKKLGVRVATSEGMIRKL